MLKTEEKNLLMLSKENNLDLKKIKYKNALNDKLLMKNIIEQTENLRVNRNNYNHEKIKQMHNEFEANKMKLKLKKENDLNEKYKNKIKILKNNNKDLIDEFNKLENLEKIYLEKLNITKNKSIEIDNVSKLNKKISNIRNKRNLSVIIEKKNCEKKISSAQKNNFKNNRYNSQDNQLKKSLNSINNNGNNEIKKN
jgi:hypothetical protein